MIYKCKACDGVFQITERVDGDSGPRTDNLLYVQPPTFDQIKAKAVDGLCPPCALANVIAVARATIRGVPDVRNITITLVKGEGR